MQGAKNYQLVQGNYVLSNNTSKFSEKSVDGLKNGRVLYCGSVPNLIYVPKDEFSIVF